MGKNFFYGEQLQVVCACTHMYVNTVLKYCSSYTQIHLKHTPIESISQVHVKLQVNLAITSNTALVSRLHVREH